MDSSLDTIIHFDIKLGEIVGGEGRCFFNITERRCIHNISYNKAFDGFILWNSLSSGSTPEKVQTRIRNE
jgi:hypothetical protein